MKGKKQIEGLNCSAGNGPPMVCRLWVVLRSFWGRSEVGVGWIFLGIYTGELFIII